MFFNGKHLLKNNKKKWTLLLSLVLIFAIAASATVAYMIVPTEDYDYTMSSAAVTVQPLVSKDSNNLLTDVMVKNVGNAEAFVRVCIVPMYRNAANGSLHWNAPVLGTNFTISYDTSKWFESKGYYYYKEHIAIGETTGDLINSITVQTDPPKGCALFFDVLVSGIQTDPDGKPATEAWGVSVK